MGAKLLSVSRKMSSRLPDLVSGFLSVLRSDTAATLNNMMMAALTSPKETRWNGRPTAVQRSMISVG
jgi:hypothetical protein